MPCYDSRSDEERSKLRDIRDLKVPYLEGIICALISEIRRRGNLKDVVAAAEKNGMVDINSFIQEHQDKDDRRILEQLEKRIRNLEDEFSPDEQERIEAMGVIGDLCSRIKDKL